MKDAWLWQELNAYADGELRGERRARLEALLAEDPALGDTLERITGLKQGLAADRPETPEKQAPDWQRPAAAIAACLVAALLGIFAYLPPDPAPTWQERLVAAHVELSDATFVVEQNRPLPVVSSRRLNDFAVPDLRASRLFLVEARSRQEENGEHLTLHYRGLRGCTLTIAAIAPVEETAEDWRAAEGRLFAGWRIGKLGFGVIADGMDRARFLAIADYVKAAIADRLRPEDPLRTAMADSYRAAKPCA
jgi:anti-sigma factor RsiW